MYPFSFFTKNIILTTCFFSVLSISFAQVSDPTDNMKNVKLFHTYYYEAYDVEMKKDNVIFYKKRKTLFRSLSEYDTNGNQILLNHYDPNTDNLHESYIYTYDSNNRLKEETYVLMGKVFGGKTTYFYDKDGRKSKMEYYSNKNELKSTVRFTYNGKGNLMTEKTYNTANMVIKELQYKYDERGNQIEMVNLKNIFLKKNNDPYREIKSFDSLNRLTSRTHYKNDSLEWIYTATYDVNSRLIMEQTKDRNDKLMSEARYAYDKKGRLSETYNYESSHPGLSPMRITYLYNKKGLNYKRYIYIRNAPTSSITKQYYFDEQGNWTMWIEISHVDDTKAVGTRKITYF